MVSVGRLLHMLHRVSPAMPHRRGWLALLSPDRIRVHPQQALGRLMVHRSALSRIASDYLPFIAQIVMG